MVKKSITKNLWDTKGWGQKIKWTKCRFDNSRKFSNKHGIRQGSANEKGDNRIGDGHNVADKITQQDLAINMG